ncbi:MAG: hypothetical protein U0232_23100 [Thermomicrobiales bacterium]
MTIPAARLDGSQQREVGGDQHGVGVGEFDQIIEPVALGATTRDLTPSAWSSSTGTAATGCSSSARGHHQPVPLAAAGQASTLPVLNRARAHRSAACLVSRMWALAKVPCLDRQFGGGGEPAQVVATVARADERGRQGSSRARTPASRRRRAAPPAA